MGVIAEGNGAWSCDQRELAGGIDAMRARDLLTESFFAAQASTFANVQQRLGKQVTEESVRRSVEAAVRIAFERTGGDWERPDRISLARAGESLAQIAASWGTPASVLEHHRCRLMEVLDAITG